MFKKKSKKHSPVWSRVLLQLCLHFQGEQLQKRKPEHTVNMMTGGREGGRLTHSRNQQCVGLCEAYLEVRDICEEEQHEAEGNDPLTHRAEQVDGVVLVERTTTPSAPSAPSHTHTQTHTQTHTHLVAGFSVQFGPFHQASADDRWCLGKGNWFRPVVLLASVCNYMENFYLPVRRHHMQGCSIHKRHTSSLYLDCTSILMCVTSSFSC